MNGYQGRGLRHRKGFRLKMLRKIKERKNNF